MVIVSADKSRTESESNASNSIRSTPNFRNTWCHDYKLQREPPPPWFITSLGAISILHLPNVQKAGKLLAPENGSTLHLQSITKPIESCRNSGDPVFVLSWSICCVRDTIGFGWQQHYNLGSWLKARDSFHKGFCLVVMESKTRVESVRSKKKVKVKPHHILVSLSVYL